MEPTYALFMTIAKLVLIIIFAIIPFLFGVFSNISTKFHKVFFIAGRIISILLAISIAAGLSVGIVFVTEDAFEARPSYIYACYFCGLITAFIPLSTFYFTTCKKTKKQRFAKEKNPCGGLQNNAYLCKLQVERFCHGKER